MRYAELWRELRRIGADRLCKAVEFYDRSPTGQYDDEAALALRAVVAQMQRDEAAKQRLI